MNTTDPVGYVKMPALDDELCPCCAAANHGDAVSVWRVTTAGGLHYECDVCANQWTPDVAHRS